MKYQYFLLFILGCFLSINLQAQCPEENITITTQSELNTFAQTYPNCSIIPGNLYIRSMANTAEPINLSGLSNITAIEI